MKKPITSVVGYLTIIIIASVCMFCASYDIKVVKKPVVLEPIVIKAVP